MRTQTFVATDIRQAMRLAREILGDEVFIVSQRRVREGVELVAGIEETTASLSNLVTTETVETSQPAFSNSPLEHPVDDLLDTAPLPERAPPQITLLENLQTELGFIRETLQTQFKALLQEHSNVHDPVSLLIKERLNAVGFNEEIILQTLKSLPAPTGFVPAMAEVIHTLEQRMPIYAQKPSEAPRMITVFGPSGVGKTTTLVKIATRYILDHAPESVLLITTDTHRIAAREQLVLYGQLLGVQVEVCPSQNHIQPLLNEAMGRELVLIDTAGLSQQDTVSLHNQLEILEATERKTERFLTLSANIAPQTLAEIIAQYQPFQPDGVIVTKLDETRHPGNILSQLMLSNLPIAYTTAGQRIPQDLEVASRRWFMRFLQNVLQAQTNSELTTEPSI